MTPGQAIDETVHLKSLFPKMTQGEVEYWCDKFERFDQAAVHAAVGRYADHNSERVDRAALLELIAMESRRAARPTSNPQLDRARCDEHWAAVDAAIAGLTVERRAAMARAAYQSLPEGTRRMIDRMHPTPVMSRVVRSLIFAALHPETAHA